MSFPAFVASLVHFVVALWSWILASDVRSLIALGVIMTGTNGLIRFKTSKAWIDFCIKHPRLVGSFLVLKGLFPESGTIWRGFLALKTGQLRERANRVDPQHVYEGFADAIGWKNFTGAPMPPWENLPEPMRVAWAAAALRGQELAS